MKRLQLLIGTALTLPMFVFAPMVAYAQTTTTENPSSSNKADDTKDKAAKAKEKADAKAKRLESNKKQFAVKLNPSDEARLKARCKLAQTKGKTLADNIAKNNTARVEAYSKITIRLDKLIKKMQDENIDSKTLESQTKELNNLISTYNANLKLYQTALSDLNEIDCVTDPTAFKVSLEASRAARAVVAKDAAAIRTYVSGTIKTTLTTAKIELAKDNPETTEGAQ